MHTATVCIETDYAMTVPEEPTVPAMPEWGVLTVAVTGDERHAALVTSDGRRQLFLTDDDAPALTQARRAALVIKDTREAVDQFTRITINGERVTR